MKSATDDALEQIDRAIDEVEKVVVGQRSLIRKVFIALLSDGHVLLEGALVFLFLERVDGGPGHMWTSVCAWARRIRLRKEPRDGSGFGDRRHATTRHG